MKYPKTYGVMLNWYGLDLTDDQIQMFGRKDLLLCRDFGDSITMFLIIDAIVIAVLGKTRHWPLVTNSRTEMRDFYREFAKMAPLVGFLLVPVFWDALEKSLCLLDRKSQIIHMSRTEKVLRQCA